MVKVLYRNFTPFPTTTDELLHGFNVGLERLVAGVIRQLQVQVLAAKTGPRQSPKCNQSDKAIEEVMLSILLSLYFNFMIDL